MYAGFHRKLFLSIFIVSLFHLLLFAGGLYMVLQLDVPLTVLGERAGSPPRWLMMLSLQEPWFLRLSVLGGIAFMLGFSILANIGVRRLYRRTDSVELLFLILFCLSFALEAWRPLNLLFPALGFSQYLNIVITRLVLMSRFFGLLCLLTASLYAVGMSYSQYGILIAGMAVLSLTLAGILPLDTSLYEPTFLIKLGDRQGYLFVRIIFALLMVINFLVAARMRHSRRFAVAAGATLLLVVGRELLSYGIAPLPIVLGTALLVLGFAFFVRQIVVFYLGF